MPESPEVVVVTGASAGVGRAVVRRFAREGASIALLARGRDGLEGAAREVEAAGGRALVLPTDVANWDQVNDAARRTEEAFGPIDVWVNNAMASVFSPVREMRPEEYRRVTEVTYLGSVHGTLAALERMLPRDRGAIVQVGSALAYRGIPLQSAYCAAKHAIQGFMDSLRCELLHDGSKVTLTHVHLPAMNTPQFGWVKSRLPHKAMPVPPIYQPEVAAEGIYWAAHHDRRELWVGYPNVQGDRGQSHRAGGSSNRYLALHGVPRLNKTNQLWGTRRVRNNLVGSRCSGEPPERHGPLSFKGCRREGKPRNLWGVPLLPGSPLTLLVLCLCLPGAGEIPNRGNCCSPILFPRPP